MLKKLLPVVVLLFLTACACPHFGGGKEPCCCTSGKMCVMKDGKCESCKDCACCKDANKDGKCDCCKDGMCGKDGKMCMMSGDKSNKDGMKCEMCLKAAKDKTAAKAKISGTGSAK